LLRTSEISSSEIWGRWTIKRFMGSSRFFFSNGADGRLDNDFGAAVLYLFFFPLTSPPQSGGSAHAVAHATPSGNARDRRDDRYFE
jgi:hypothetical protein